MGLVDLIRRLLGGGGSRRAGGADRGPGLGLMDLSRRLRLPALDLQRVGVHYDEFTIPKRCGGARKILAPAPELKALQRRILRRLLARLRVHPAAMGFERGRSIVTNARAHAGSAVVIHMDIRDFFGSTATGRVREYFTAIGWGSEAVYLLLKWTMADGHLPQGAPTSPRLSNLVNYEMDTRLAALAESIGAVYTRYADDLVFSLRTDRRLSVTSAIRGTKAILDDYGYRLHLKRKLSIRRRHQRQTVTGLVVNDGVALPRETRRRLRAVEHHLRTGRTATLTPEQLAGWRALMAMIERQRA